MPRRRQRCGPYVLTPLPLVAAVLPHPASESLPSGPYEQARRRQSCVWLPRCERAGDRLPPVNPDPPGRAKPPPGGAAFIGSGPAPSTVSSIVPTDTT
jgi:hypothetical protein